MRSRHALSIQESYHIFQRSILLLSLFTGTYNLLKCLHISTQNALRCCCWAANSIFTNLSCNLGNLCRWRLPRNVRLALTGIRIITHIWSGPSALPRNRCINCTIFLVHSAALGCRRRWQWVAAVSSFRSPIGSRWRGVRSATADPRRRRRCRWRRGMGMFVHDHGNGLIVRVQGAQRIHCQSGTTIQVVGRRFWRVVGGFVGFT